MRIQTQQQFFLAENKFIASHGKAEKCRGCSRQNEMFLRSVSRSKFEAIVGSDMRTLFAIFGLLLCLSPARADELRHAQGKVVGITGTIELYQGRPEIKVISIDQIKGLP